MLQDTPHLRGIRELSEMKELWEMVATLKRMSFALAVKNCTCCREFVVESLKIGVIETSE